MSGYKLASGSQIVAPQAGDLLGIYRPVNTSDNNRREYLIENGSVAINVVPTVTAAGTNLLTVGLDAQTELFSFGAGGGAYTYNIDLDKVGAIAGNSFSISITKAASTNPTIVVRNGSAGTTLISINNASAQTWDTLFVYNGTDWVKVRAVLNDL